jgi:hypothetical protein
MKSSTTAAIILLSLAAVFMLVLMMQVGAGGLADSSAGERTKLTFTIRDKWKFANVATDPTPESPVLYIQYDVRFAEEPPSNRDDEYAARRLHDAGRSLFLAKQDADAEKKFAEIREKYRDTAAYVDLELWEVARFAGHEYQGKDREKIEKVKVVRRAIYGAPPVEEIREKAFELELPKSTGPKRDEIKRGNP